MQDKSVITSQMLRTVGVDSEPMAHQVELGAIRRFADAIGDPNPIYRDEGTAAETRHGKIIAPPTFLRSLKPGPAIVDLDIPYPEVLDGGSKWEFFQPVRTGDLITVTSKVTDLKERKGRLGPMLIVVRENSFRDSDGTIVGTELSTYIYYSPKLSDGDGQ